ncbi:prephenate dehydrogenase [Clostridiales bacterium PH28_bin88]|nr:prephenate dehydrogenase [Clostridiales bacterium PH28_bin88]
MRLPVRKVTIIGLGLIGGSLGMAWTQGGAVQEVNGVDMDPEALQMGLETRAIHRGTTDLAEGVKDADIVVLATPVGQVPEMARRISPYLKPGCVVTDVGSTKRGIVDQLEASLPPGVHYVGGHPMAGSEQAGIRAADRYLFENAVYLLTPTTRTSAAALEQVTKLVGATGARVITIDPDEHDLIVAAVSHLPHLLAVALVGTVDRVALAHPEALMLAAGGFRDTTRVAGGNPVMWRDICLANREKLLQMLGYFRRVLDEMETSIEAGDGPDLARRFEQARSVRGQIPAKMKGLLPSLYEVVVTVPDRPGVIGQMARLLGDHDINIIDIEILRVREGEGGSIRLGFQTEPAANRSVEVLRENGIIAKRR